ncbi:MAG TPA: hypothetical protein VLZ83_07400, partial [Edaphocola sp.]|nr:hypothetical protein [Edaphocola sp.]
MKTKIKKTAFTIGLASFAISAIALSGCTSSAQKKEKEANKAAENVQEARKDLDQAKKEYVVKYEA